jgi:AcrR family transcriptional regulator
MRRRLTRTESQEKTREKLLATAKQSFLRDGYVATSLDQIAEAAGFSKGAVYSNFESKDELCLLVLDAIRAERVASLAEAVVGQSTFEDRIAAFQRWAEKNIGDRAWTALEVEFGVHAARDPELSRAFSKRNRAIRERAAVVVAAFAAERDAPLPLPAEEVALALLSLGVGLGVQRAIDPGLSVRVLADLLSVFAGTPRPAVGRPSLTKRRSGGGTRRHGGGEGG